MESGEDLGLTMLLGVTKLDNLNLQPIVFCLTLMKLSLYNLNVVRGWEFRAALCSVHNTH